MPRAIRGSPHPIFLVPEYPSLPMLGVLIECDPSIKSIIVSIDSANHDYIIEDLDDERVVVKETMVSTLKHKLEERLKENLPPEEESGSE
ncbi:RNA polymerase II transcription factor B subunit 5 [Fusarium mexicanum]|uniref:General transcription and DNA repair factor IIH subunit TFB5 n=1 Tax=Fusarium mexicanum TaxID=751941 RepID=A0A8H5MIR7_9HYPO|nr:RNA polymerase II transcription factor B subunit 5 [Fusarium mexicanum]